MNTSDVFEAVGDFDPTQYEAEVKERWGETDAYAESARRTARYSKDDWKGIMAERGAVTTELGARLAAGASPADDDVQALVDRHREHLDRRFYPCSIEMQLNLGESTSRRRGSARPTSGFSLVWRCSCEMRSACVPVARRRDERSSAVL